MFQAYILNARSNPPDASDFGWLSGMGGAHGRATGIMAKLELSNTSSELMGRSHNNYVCNGLQLRLECS